MTNTITLAVTMAVTLPLLQSFLHCDVGVSQHWFVCCHLIHWEWVDFSLLRGMLGEVTDGLRVSVDVLHKLSQYGDIFVRLHLTPHLCLQLTENIVGLYHGSQQQSGGSVQLLSLNLKNKDKL